VVLIEVRVDPNGSVVEATVRQTSPPFDDAALSAAGQWTFRPARVGGRAVTSLVYIMFACPMPVV
jgi:TonB family protein